jgi:hypothetical protein
LLATVVAKNAVGSSWVKTVATREWSRVPEDEKSFVRTSTVRVLLHDPSERVALQAALLMANIARFDVPSPWSGLLTDLSNAARNTSAFAFAVKPRALRALKHTLRALRSKRFIIGRSDQHERELSFDEIEAASLRVDEERAEMFSQARALLASLRQEWESSFTSLLAKSSDWEVHGALAVGQLACLRELLTLLLDVQNIEGEFDSLMRDGAQAAATVVGPLFSAGSSAGAVAVSVGLSDPHTSLLSKCWERLLQLALVAMDRHTVAFAAHLPAWATLCVNTAMLEMDAAAVHGIRPKSRVLLTRFVARALIQPLYRQEAVGEELDALGLGMILPAAARQRRNAALPALRAASSALDDLFTARDGKCAALVEAIVAKYIILSPDELAEWEADPEGFARQVDAETSPDADAPRPCGVALLECMLERAEEPVASALVGLASAVQGQQLTRETVLGREAAYRAIGECFPHLRSRVDFRAWYAGELRSLLGAPGTERAAGPAEAVLTARALWLVGVCGDELQPEAWGEAFGVAVNHVASHDLVIALMAVSAATALLGHALEEQQFVLQPRDQQRLWLEGPLSMQGEVLEDDVVTQADAEFRTHFAAIDAMADSLMASCFALLPRLEEAESMVRVLHCVSAVVELMGERVRSHLGSITGALPQVWGLLQTRANEGTGALARLHCSLLAMLSHLISKLGVAAAEEPQVASVLLPLLYHATNITSPEAEPLLEDGLKLWLAVLQAAPSLSSPLKDLVPLRLMPLIHRGKDGALCLRIAEAYALLGGVEVVSPLLPLLSEAIASSLRDAMGSMAPKQGSQPGTIVLGSLSPDMASDASAAASLLSVLHRVYDTLPQELEQPYRAAVALVGGDYGAGVLRLPARSTAVIESCLDAVYHLLWRSPGSLQMVTDGDRAVQDRLLDRWLALGSIRDVGELFIPSLGAMGRTRRHIAAIALCALFVADASPGLHEVERAAQAVVVGLKAAREQMALEADHQRLAEAQIDTAHADQLLLRRLELARGDPMRVMDAKDAARAAVGHFAAWAGREQAMAALDLVDPLYKEQAAALLATQLTEAEADAAVASMQQTGIR